MIVCVCACVYVCMYVYQKKAFLSLVYETRLGGTVFRNRVVPVLGPQCQSSANDLHASTMSMCQENPSLSAQGPCTC